MFESRHSKSLFLEQTFPNPLISFDRLYTHNVYHQSATKPLKEVWGNSKKIQEASRNKTALPLQSLFEAHYPQNVKIILWKRRVKIRHI